MVRTVNLSEMDFSAQASLLGHRLKKLQRRGSFVLQRLVTNCANGVTALLVCSERLHLLDLPQLPLVLSDPYLRGINIASEKFSL